jgi:Mrp family chromosome partitioning ATPase
MSTTNRAFIKAYAPREPSASAVETRQAKFLAAAAKPSAPRAAFADGAALDAGLELTSASPSAVRPLSAFVPEVEVAETLAPALEVESFLWPEICEQLLEQAGEAFGHWANQLIAEARSGRRLIMLSGATRGEGRTTALLCLARTLAQRGARTVVVDADFQKPGLAAALGVAAPAGWEDVLATGVPLEEVLILSNEEQLTLLPLGDQVEQPQHLARALQAPVGLRTLAEQFDVVLVDAGPVYGDGATAGLLLQQLSDASVILTRNARAGDGAASRELENQLRAVNIRLLVVAEMFCPPQSLSAKAA